jgi:nicotinamidase/pyrazinamidase
VLATALDAARAEFTTTVIEDFIAGVAQETSEKALDDLRAKGVAVA